MISFGCFKKYAHICTDIHSRYLQSNGEKPVENVMLKMGNMKRILIFLMLLVSISLSAQDVAVKTNLLYDATTTINLGAEIGVAPKWTVDLSANYNGWTFNDNKKWKHWMAQPEVRYWFCERFNGHFLGAHLLCDVAHLGVHISITGAVWIFPWESLTT